MIELKNINKSFYLGGETIKALDNINFKVEKGEFVSIIGPSGSGKTTLMNILGLLDIPDSGTYTLDGVQISTASDNELAKRLSKVDNYFEIVTEALKEMYRQTGKSIFNDKGIMQKGMIIRHLVLPNHILNSRRVLKWINENMHDVYVSVMAQYFPTYKAKDIDDINRKLAKEEYEQIENYLYRLDLENGYIQELGEHEEEYVPKWEI